MKILVVEDEIGLADALEKGLEADGFNVDVTHDGKDGLWKALEQSYDAIILDILLPGMNGFKVCSTLREQGCWTPILMLTAKDGELDEAEALDTGADDFLSKPFSFLVLQARLRALLRRGGAPRPAILTAGDLQLDPASRRCTRGDVVIDLTRREDALLEYLMRSAGVALSRQEILDHVWDFARGLESNLVEVYIGYLRRKIDTPFGRNAIQTVRGHGYRLDPGGG